MIPLPVIRTVGVLSEELSEVVLDRPTQTRLSRLLSAEVSFSRKWSRSCNLRRSPPPEDVTLLSLVLCAYYTGVAPEPDWVPDISCGTHQPQ